MKGMIIVIDGLPDLPNQQLNGETPLEAAETPNLDYFSSKGELGLMHPIKEGVLPESDTALTSILGNERIESKRGWFEAISTNIKLERGDLCVRTNFATITDILKDRKIKDRRAGRTLTSKEAEILTNAINKKLRLSFKFIFKNTIQHRGILVLRGGFSDNITNTDPEHIKNNSKNENYFKFSQPLDDEENTKFSANRINEFIEKSHELLKNHPINMAREKKGLMPANIILTRDANIDPPKIKKFSGWGSIAYMHQEIGVTKESGMKIFSFGYPKMKDYDVYENLNKSLDKACIFAKKTLEKNKKEQEYFYIHFKETDVPSHDNKPLEKKSMIEKLDKDFFGFLREFSEKNNIKIVITSDHASPCEKKGHSADPVPVIIFNPRKKLDKDRKFSEKEAKKGELGFFLGKELLGKAGFSR